jgi:hypothetical protein
MYGLMRVKPMWTGSRQRGQVNEVIEGGSSRGTAASGQSRRFERDPATSAVPSTPDISLRRSEPSRRVG